jgi:hypothetical protein
MNRKDFDFLYGSEWRSGRFRLNSNTALVKGEGKIALKQAMKALNGSSDITLLFL